MRSILAVGISLLLFACASNKTEEKYYYTPFLMDTLFEITIYHTDEASADKLSRECIRLIRDLEERYSATEEDSLIAELNRTGNLTLDSESRQVFSNAIAFRDWTEGAFDPTLYLLSELWGFPDSQFKIPSEEIIASGLKLSGPEHLRIEGDTLYLTDGARVGLGAVMKGYAVDRAIEFLEREGVSNALVNAGGNLRTLGNKPNGETWGIAIRHPRSLSEFYRVLRFYGSKAFATSGDYERFFEEEGVRYHHILSPETGRPSRGPVISVTISADTAEESDALATALFVMGHEKGLAFANAHQIAALFIMETNDTIYSAHSDYWSYE